MEGKGLEVGRLMEYCRSHIARKKSQVMHPEIKE